MYYFETTSAWPYDPVRDYRVCDSDYALPYLARVADSFGLGDRWAYRRSYLDNEWFGMSQTKAEELLLHADAVFNVAGATRPAEDHLKIGRLIYFGTDPVIHEVGYANGDEETLAIMAEHDDVVTYGENIGTPNSLLPPLPRLRARTRQPMLIDLWKGGPPSREAFTTVGNWKQEGREVEFRGEVYLWSKHHEFLKFIDLPGRIDQPIELAMNLTDPKTIQHGEGEVVRALGVEPPHVQRHRPIPVLGEAVVHLDHPVHGAHVVYLPGVADRTQARDCGHHSGAEGVVGFTGLERVEGGRLWFPGGKGLGATLDWRTLESNGGVPWKL